MTEVTAHLRGVNFRPTVAKEVVLALNVGDKLSLEREPSNKFDENAIRVLHPDEEAEDSRFLGYVAKEVAVVIAPLMDEGTEYSAEVYSFYNTITPVLFISPVKETETETVGESQDAA